MPDTVPDFGGVTPEDLFAGQPLIQSPDLMLVWRDNAKELISRPFGNSIRYEFLDADLRERIDLGQAFNPSDWFPVIDENIGTVGASKIIGGTIQGQRIVVGVTGSTNSFIRSQNWNGTVDTNNQVTLPGTQGWIINANGNAIFQNAFIRGTIEATEGLIGEWRITAEGLDSGSGSTFVGLSANNLSPYRIWAGAENPINAPFSVQRDGTLIASRGFIASWKIESDLLSSGSGSGYVALISDDSSQEAIIIGAESSAFAPFVVNRDGSLKATEGRIGGWLILSDNLRSSSSGAGLELDQVENRVTVYTAAEDKVAMGYLGGLPKYGNPSEFWDSSDYGFWVREGDNLVIDGNVEYENGDWLIENDASIRIQNSSGNDIIRIGTSAGAKGLFFFDGQGNANENVIGFITESELNLGNKFIWDGSTLSIDGTITSTDGSIGGWTIETGRLQSTNIALISGTNAAIWLGSTVSSSLAKIVLNNDGSGKLADGFITWGGDGSFQLGGAQGITFAGSGNVQIGTDVDIAGTITANQVRTGRLESENWSASNGSFIDLDDGTFQFGGGSSKTPPYLEFNGITLLLQEVTLADADGEIAGWEIDPDQLFTSGIWIRSGTNAAIFLGDDEYSTSGIALLADGSGHLANRNIEWDENGDLTFSADVKLDWDFNIENIPTNLASLGDIPSYIESTQITATTIQSPTIAGNDGIFTGRLAIGTSPNQMLIGSGVFGPNSGIRINASNFWYNNGAFRIGGSQGISFEGSTVNVGSDLNMTGSTITASLFRSNTNVTFADEKGVFLGLDGGEYKFRVGDPNGAFISWDGDNFTVNELIPSIASARVTDVAGTGSTPVEAPTLVVTSQNHLVTATYTVLNDDPTPQTITVELKRGSTTIGTANTHPLDPLPSGTFEVSDGFQSTESPGAGTHTYTIEFTGEFGKTYQIVTAQLTIVG